MTIEELMAEWADGTKIPGKDELFNRDAHMRERGPSCMCAQGQILHYVFDWSYIELAECEQHVADAKIAELLKIPLSCAVGIRRINDGYGIGSVLHMLNRALYSVNPLKIC